jgi:hypothetical protein
MDPPGFADVGLAMIHGDYYRTNAKANEHRRPVLLQAWLAEFADVVFHEVILNPIYGSAAGDGHNAALYHGIQNKGAIDILKENVDCLASTSSYFVSVRSADNRKRVQEACARILKQVWGKRNVFTHQRITNSDFLRDMLGRMIDFCHLFLTMKWTLTDRMLSSRSVKRNWSTWMLKIISTNLCRFKRE